MENKRVKHVASKSEEFIEMVTEAKLGNKNSIESILLLFKDEIEDLSRFIMLPREEAHQILETELIDIILEKL